MDIADRLAGAVWGHLVGDAVGVPYEFRAAVGAGAVVFGATGTHGQPPGTWSDDGALMLALLDSLLTAGFDPADFGHRALDWYRRGAFTPDGDGCFDIGNATRAALERLEAGTLPEEAGGTDEYSCGNGSLMRILPLALVERDIAADVLVEHAHRLSAVTHGHPRVRVACALYVLIARSLLRGHSRSDALGWARRRLREIYAAGSDPDRAVHLAALDHLESWPERAGRGRVWDSFWSAWDAFAGAGSYREAIERAVAYGNDTDTTAAIAGGLAGLRFGLDGIPADWLAGMRGGAIVGKLVDRLVETTGRRTSTGSPLRVDWLDPADLPLLERSFSTLGMTFLPGKRASGIAGEHWRDLDADLDWLRDVHGCDVLVLLVEDAELAAFGVARLPAAAAARGIELLRHPIPDGGVPADRPAFRVLLDGVAGRLRVGASVVVACRGGLGRTGLVVACLLRDLAGLDAESAVAITRSHRHGAIETDDQRAFIEAWTPSDRASGDDLRLADRLRALADLLPILEAPDADFGSWAPPSTEGGVTHLPYYTFGPAGEAFQAAVGRGGWIFPFDWGAWLQTAEGRALTSEREALAAATPLQLARLLTAIVRSDRFTEGSIAGAFESGLLSAIARRAAVLLAELEG
jgi:ADP-ribosylglycohydrolase